MVRVTSFQRLGCGVYIATSAVAIRGVAEIMGIALILGIIASVWIVLRGRK
jgi:transcription-repair coupling factor (superfamily II helicase)